MYSLRNVEKTHKVTEKFWTALSSYFIKLTEEMYFMSCMDGYSYDYSFSNYLMNLKIASHIGIKPFPLEEKLSDDEIFDLIEAIYQIIEVPNSSPKGTTISNIRYEFTLQINKMFQNFKMNYILIKGEIKALHSEELNELFLDSFNCFDKEIKEFIQIALEKFKSRDIKEQRIGLNKLVDAYERIKMLENPKDKKESAKKISELVDKETAFFETDMMKMTRIANNEFMIRHTELDKTKIESVVVIEYLFYLYYNSIRAILLAKEILINNWGKNESNIDNFDII